MLTRRALGSAALLLIGMVVVSAVGASRTVYETTSEFNEIAVIDTDDGLRELVFGDGTATQTAMRLARPQELVLGYTRAAMAGLAIVPEPERILIVGLGGGAMPMFLHRALPKARIDVAELDPVVLKVAREYFSFQEDDLLRVHIGDGRQFIERTRNRYDLVFLDAYGEDNIPMALATREFLVLVRRIVKPDGVVVANLWSSDSNRLYPAMVRTYADVFPEMHIIRVADRSNRILLALPRERGFTREDLARQAARLRAPGVAELKLPGLIRSGYIPEPGISRDAEILRDPVPASVPADAR